MTQNGMLRYKLPIETSSLIHCKHNYSLVPVIRRKPCLIIASPQVSVPLISRPVGSYRKAGPLLYKLESGNLFNTESSESKYTLFVDTYLLNIDDISSI